MPPLVAVESVGCRRDGDPLFYTSTVRAANELRQILLGYGVNAGLYHGRLKANEREDAQREDEPQREDDPAPAGAPHRDSDGPGLH